MVKDIKLLPVWSIFLNQTGKNFKKGVKKNELIFTRKMVTQCRKFFTVTDATKPCPPLGWFAFANQIGVKREKTLKREFADANLFYEDNLGVKNGMFFALTDAIRSCHSLFSSIFELNPCKTRVNHTKVLKREFKK